jgi:hypothetical protein
LNPVSPDSTGANVWPLPLEQYHDSHVERIADVLLGRIALEPANLWVTVIFLGAVIHTFMTHRFRALAHRVESRGGSPVLAHTLHFLGEVEAIFGIWVIPLLFVIQWYGGWHNAVEYLNHRVNYAEPLFVVVIMTIASTRPVLSLAENVIAKVARLGGSTPRAWWFSLLTIGPLLGSLITEPAAMTITGLLLAHQFYERKPSRRFAYGTIGLLFVNISVGGVLTHFAAPPVLMVAAPWGWTTPYMFRHFGLASITGIAASTLLYGLFFRREFQTLQPSLEQRGEQTRKAVPVWVTVLHLAFLGWSVYAAHYPALLIGGFLFFLAVYDITQEYQESLALRPALLVGFFLAGLVIHGGLQQWWIAPVMRRLGEIPLMLGAIFLTSFNDNAAITYLATLVPDLSEALKHAVVSGAVIGGGLTVIANAPNPAGQSLLGKYFSEGVAPLNLFLGALPATLIMVVMFLLIT